MAVFLRRNPCPNAESLESAIRSAGRDDLQFVAAEQFDELVEALKRIEQFGPSNMDEGTRNDLKVKEINYVVWLKVVHTLVKNEDDCSFHLGFDLSIDVGSVESTSISSGTVDAVMENLTRPGGENKSLAVEVGNHGERYTLTAGSAPVCLGQSRIEVHLAHHPGETMRAWDEDLGCFGPQEHKTFDIKSTNGPRAYLRIVPASECERFVSEKFGMTGGGEGSGTGNLPGGAWTRPCGCWGPAYPGATNESPQCSSGLDVAVACPAYCPGGGYAWGTRCE